MRYNNNNGSNTNINNEAQNIPTSKPNCITFTYLRGILNQVGNEWAYLPGN